MIPNGKLDRRPVADMATLIGETFQESVDMSLAMIGPVRFGVASS
ncbi:hypothetical protein [Acidisphaera sp. L21]|nr:hypothetical protein [Acidisphaera sp. L21]